MMKRLFYFLMIASLVAAACSDQKEPGGDRVLVTEKINIAAGGGQGSGAGEPDQQDAMHAAKAFFKQQYPQAGAVKWTEDDNGYYEASFELAGAKYRADYTKEGEWVETERSIKYKDLPKAVQKAIEAEYNKQEIKEIEQVDNAARGKFYDVEFKDKGKNKDVEFREDGQLIGT